MTLAVFPIFSQYNFYLVNFLFLFCFPVIISSLKEREVEGEGIIMVGAVTCPSSKGTISTPTTRTRTDKRDRTTTRGCTEQLHQKNVLEELE